MQIVCFFHSPLLLGSMVHRMGNEASIGQSPEPIAGTMIVSRWLFFQVNQMGSFSESRFLRGILALTLKHDDDDDEDEDEDEERGTGERAILINHEYLR